MDQLTGCSACQHTRSSRPHRTKVVFSPEVKSATYSEPRSKQVVGQCLGGGGSPQHAGLSRADLYSEQTQHRQELGCCAKEHVPEVSEAWKRAPSSIVHTNGQAGALVPWLPALLSGKTSSGSGNVLSSGRLNILQCQAGVQVLEAPIILPGEQCMRDKTSRAYPAHALSLELSLPSPAPLVCANRGLHLAHAGDMMLPGFRRNRLNRAQPCKLRTIWLCHSRFCC